MKYLLKSRVTSQLIFFNLDSFFNYESMVTHL